MPTKGSPLKFLPLLILFLGLSATHVTAEENNMAIFTPYLDTPPKIIEVISKTEEEGVEVTRLKFLNRTIPGEDPVIIYGVLARPLSKGPHPAVLSCHGGGGRAVNQQHFVIAWAKKGYVSFCQDQPGVTYTNQLKISSGPWSKLNWNNVFPKNNDATQTNLYDGVLSALHGLAFLRSQPDVDKKRVGVTGGSWGGYMTHIISGIAGDRIKASFSIYGCGYYDVSTLWVERMDPVSPESRAAWVAALDAGRKAPGITSNFFSFPAANDWFFWPGSVMKTYDRISSPKNICFSPNTSHKLTPPGGTLRVNRKENRTHMEILWMDHHLKGKGPAFSSAAQSAPDKRIEKAVEVQFSVKTTTGITPPSIYFSYGEKAWRTRWWKKVSCTEVSKNTFTARIPVDEPRAPIHWFGLASEKGRDFSCSTVINTITPSALGFTNKDHVPAFWSEDFEADTKLIAEKWRKPYIPPKDYRLSFSKPATAAAHSGKMGLLIRAKSKVRTDALRGLNLISSKAKGLTFWARALTPGDVTLTLVAETSEGRRSQWSTQPIVLGTEWQQVSLPWADFKAHKTKQHTPTLLHKELGQVVFTSSETSEVHIDDISVIRP